MLKPVPSIIAALAVALVTVSTAAAITGGGVDGDAHPYVGALVVDGSVRVLGRAGRADRLRDRRPLRRRRQSRLRQLRLEAGTTAGASRAEPSRSTPRRAPIWPSSCSMLRQRVAPAALPAAGSAGSLVKGALVTSVGYGYSGWAADGSFVYDGFRRVGELARLKRSTKSTITLSTSTAGPCLGDSGGPQLSGSTVLSVTSDGLEGLRRQGRGLSPRHAVGARASSAASSRFRNPRPGSTVAVTWKCCWRCCSF